jgi:hypothetical protein
MASGKTLENLMIVLQSSMLETRFFRSCEASPVRAAGLIAGLSVPQFGLSEVFQDWVRLLACGIS